MVRKLAWICLGFSGAIFGITGWLWGKAPIIAAAFAVLAVLTGLSSLRFRGAAFPALVFLGALLGSCWLLLLQKTYYFPLYQLDTRTVSGEIMLTSYPEATNYGFQASGSFNWLGHQYPLRVYVSEDSLEPGMILDGSFRIQLTLPEGSKASQIHPGNRILALASPKGEYRVLPGRAGSVRFLPQRLANRVKEILQACLPEDVSPFALSILLGDSSGLDYKTKTNLSVSGIRHIVAVSGLHIGVLCGAIWFITARRRYLTAVVGIPILVLFAAMVGFTPSVCRACLMAGMMMLSTVFAREYDGLTELAFSVLVLALINPFEIQAAGFQLSVLSVLGILLFQPGLSERFRENLTRRPKKGFVSSIIRYSLDSLSVTLSAMSLSTPVAVYYFGLVSIVSPLTNLVCLGLVSVCFYGIAGVSALGAIYLPLGKLLGAAVAFPMRWILAIAACFSRFPLAALYTASPYTVPFLVVAYILVILLFVCREKGKLLSAAALIASFAACVVLPSLGPRMDECRLTVLDVGQGQSLLLQSKGESMVVDCGGWSEESSASAAAEMLLSQNIHTLKALSLTHYDEDHCGGVENLLTRVKANALILPGNEGELAFPELSQPRKAILEPFSMPLGAGTVHFYPYYGGSSDHENSMTVLFETENCGILITGDLDAAGERALLHAVDLPKVDILVVGHHGSKTSTSQELLDGVAPRIAAISVGENNRYGHPTEQVLERLEQAGCRIYRTDQQGTLVFRR